jgi:hypothetical protein
MQEAQGHVPELGAAVWVKAQNFGYIHDNDRFLGRHAVCAPSGQFSAV